MGCESVLGCKNPVQLKHQINGSTSEPHPVLHTALKTGRDGWQGQSKCYWWKTTPLSLVLYGSDGDYVAVLEGVGVVGGGGGACLVDPRQLPGTLFHFTPPCHHCTPHLLQRVIPIQQSWGWWYIGLSRLCPEDIFWATESFATKLVMVVCHHKQECHVLKNTSRSRSHWGLI